MSCIGNSEENIDLSQIYLAVHRIEKVMRNIMAWLRLYGSQPQRVEDKMNKSLRNITMTMDKRIKDAAEFEIKLQKSNESTGANIDTYKVF